jgi:hypothetical protein
MKVALYNHHINFLLLIGSFTRPVSVYFYHHKVEIITHHINSDNYQIIHLTLMFLRLTVYPRIKPVSDIEVIVR